MDGLRSRVDEALLKAGQLLGAERRAHFPADVPHAYGDKFALAELATQAALSGCNSVLSEVADGWLEHRPWLSEQAANRAVSLRLNAKEWCMLERQEERVLEQPRVRRATSWLEDSMQAISLALIGQDRKVVRENSWRVGVEWELSAYAGPNPADQASSKVLGRGRGWRLVKVVCDRHEESSPPRPYATPVPPLEVEIGWLLCQLASPQPRFRIDRSAGSCHTPRRNEDVAVALGQFARVASWATDVRTWLQDALLSGMNMPQGSLNSVEQLEHPIQFADSDGDVNRLAMDGARLIWYEPDGAGGWRPWARGPLAFDLATGDLRGALLRGQGMGRAVLLRADGVRLLRSALGGSLSLGEVDEAGGGATALPLVLATFGLERSAAERAAVLSSADLEQLAAEHARHVGVGLGALQEAYPESGGQLPGARLACCSRLLSDIAVQHAAALDAVEALLRRQLVASLGKEVGPHDLEDLLCWHYEWRLRAGHRPRALSYPVQQPGTCAEGHLTIEQRPGQELRSFASCRPARRPMKMPINASVNILFVGDRCLHGAVLPCFAGQLEPLTLEARVRHFGCIVLVLGTVVSVDSFAPTAAVVLRGEESLRVPLLLEVLPTAREFRDATASLSPEQRRFAQAVRAMQLAGTVFGVLTIPVRPQLERLLSLPEGSLTQEVKLTQDILELLLTYQIPSSHLRYDGAPDAAQEAKLAVVRGDVEGLRHVVEKERRSELCEQERAELERARQEASRWARPGQRQVNSHVRLVLVGAKRSGKSSLLARYTHSTFSDCYCETARLEIRKDLLCLDGELVTLEFYDVSGAECLRSAGRHSLLGAAQGVLMMLDLTDSGALAELPELCSEAAGEGRPVILVGTKSDLVDRRAVPAEAVREFAAARGIRYVETSARDGLGVAPAVLAGARAGLEARQKQAERMQERAEELARLEELGELEQLRDRVFASKALGAPGGRSSAAGSVLGYVGSVVGSGLDLLSEARSMRSVGYCAFDGPMLDGTAIDLFDGLEEDQGVAPGVGGSPAELAGTPPGRGGAGALEPWGGTSAEVRPPAEPARGECEGQRTGPSGGEEEVDYSSIPATLDRQFEALGGGAALRPVVIKAGREWRRRSRSLPGALKESTLAVEQQREENNAAFDLLDALTCSGTLHVEAASLHVVLLTAHCFEEELLDVLVQENVNPIQPLERSALIVASTVHGVPAEQLLRPGELPHLRSQSPSLASSQLLQE